MLSLAHLTRLPVMGDGNCGFYSVLAATDRIDHCRRTRLGTPSDSDYARQQLLRDNCYEWLTGVGKAVSAFQFEADKHAVTSSWSPTMLKKLKDGKERAYDPMGYYANEPALRAMAALENVHLVVIDTQSGPGRHIRPQDRGHPFDKVHVYMPGATDAARLCNMRSWANDIVPALTDPDEPTPAYLVILHNGEKPGSAAGHFDSTVALVREQVRCSICFDDVQGECGRRGEERWGVAPCCGVVFHTRCLSRWVNGCAEVKAPCQDGREYVKRLETKRQCPACRKPLASSQALRFE